MRTPYESVNKIQPVCSPLCAFLIFSLYRNLEKKSNSFRGFILLEINLVQKVDFFTGWSSNHDNIEFFHSFSSPLREELKKSVRTQNQHSERRFYENRNFSTENKFSSQKISLTRPPPRKSTLAHSNTCLFSFGLHRRAFIVLKLDFSLFWMWKASEHTATVSTLPSAPASIQPFRAIAIQLDSVFLNWNDFN